MTSPQNGQFRLCHLTRVQGAMLLTVYGAYILIENKYGPPGQNLTGNSRWGQLPPSQWGRFTLTQPVIGPGLPKLTRAAR